MTPKTRLHATLTALAAVVLLIGCEGSMGVAPYGDAGKPPPKCDNGTDKDGDGYGKNCPAGDDCDDSDPNIHPGAGEICDGKDNNCNGKVDESGNGPCGTCDPGCNQVGKGKPFPIDPNKDPNLKDSKGVQLDPNGDLVLGAVQASFHYMWIANTYDIKGSSACKSNSSDPGCRGTISKVNTKTKKEVARYFTITCNSNPGTSGCKDVNGKTIDRVHNHTPSRTAVDFNLDVWVANRNVHGGQPSATKIANDPLDCVDRNKNSKIDTSRDHNGDGKITVDCNGDGKPDGAKTSCPGGKPPEFLGDDDECVLFTTNYAGKDDIGRSMCLDAGKSTVGASNAWVGTFNREDQGKGRNRFYKINGYTGKIEKVIDLPKGHRSYGCMADAHNYVWSTDIYGSLTYFQTIAPYGVGPKMVAPWVPQKGKTYHHYGISINADQHVWLGGYHSYWVLRYKPNRSSFSTMHKGSWTRIDVPNGFVTRGIAADDRGKVWVAIQNGGYLLRVNQSIKDGHHKPKWTLNSNYWKLTADTVIGAGVDFDGHIWGVGYKNGIASRITVDKQGNVTNVNSGLQDNVKIGKNPYTYSDFTGFGLSNFVRPSGRWVYQHKPCPKGIKAQWKQITWNATTPPGTAVALRVRTGDSNTTFGKWSDVFPKSPARFGPTAAKPIKPNPAYYIQVEFTLTNKTKGTTPTLHDYAIAYVCANNPG